MKHNELAKSLSVVWHPHPVTPYAGREVMMIAAEGYTIRQLLLNSKVDPYQEIVVYVDDKLITVEEWDTLRPTDGQLVNVQSVVSGGGNGGSNPLQIVMMIAIVALTIYTAGATTGLLGTVIAGSLTVGMVAAAVISVAGSLLMSALFKPDGLSSSDAYAQASPTYSLSGSQNRARPYESMPIVMGTHRVIFDYASRPYTEYKGEDQYLYQIFHGGVSPTRYSDYKIGTNPLSNYTDVELFYPSDTSGSLKNFPGNVDSLAGAPLTNAAGWITRTSSGNTYQLGVDIEAVLAFANNEGGIDSTSVEIEIQYKATSSGTWLVPAQIFSSLNDVAIGSNQTVTETQDQGYWDADSGDWVDNLVSVTKTKFVAGSSGVVVLSGGSQKPRRVSLTFEVPQGTYDVRVKRNTADSTDAKLNNQTNWSILKSYQVDNTNYTGQNRIGMSIKASEQLNGTVAQFSALAQSDARYWTGTAWVVAPTDIPARLFMHFAIGVRNANGKLMYGVGLPESQLDLPSLVAWADFCYAEGLTFNAVIDGNQTAADVLNAIARCGLGSPTWASGKLGVVWDYRNSSPVASFGMSNIIRDSFDVSYINENLAEEIVIRFRNPAKDWEQDEVRVLAPTITDPQRTSSIDLFGCTNAAMAGKFANYLAAQQYYRRRRITWESDFEGFVCQRGDTVLLSHDLTQWGYSGRIVSVSGNTITLDRTVPRNGAAEYLMITRPDGTMTTYNTTVETGEDNTVTLTSAPSLQSGYDLMDHRWSFSPLATPGKKVKILSIDPVSESRLRIIATDEFEEFYDAWNGTFVAPPNLTLLPPSLVQANNLTVTSRIAIINGYRTNRVTASWGVGGGVLYSRVRAYFNGELVDEVAQALVQTFEYDAYTSGDFLIEVTPFGLLGAGETISATLALGSLEAPSPPTEVTLTVGENGKSATYSWDAVPGVQSYVIEIVVSGTARRTVNIGNSLSYTYTLDDAIADGGPFRAYQFRVYSVANGIQSLTYAFENFSNPQIGSLTNATIEPMPNSLWFRCDLPTESDFKAIRIWLSTTSGFTPSSSTVVYDGPDNWVNIAADNTGNPLESGVVYYVRASGYDTYGDDNLSYVGEFSAAVLSPAWGLIQGDIDETLLEAGLRDRIDLVDAPATVANSVASRIQEEANARADAILAEATARENEDSALQTQINLLTAASTGDLQDLIAAVEEEQTARIAGDAAEALSRETLATQVRGSYAGTDVNQVTTGLIHSERTARTTADSTISSNVTALSSSLTNSVNTLNSAITNEATTRANADTALSTQLSTLSSTVTTNNTTLNGLITSEANTRAAADGALSTQINTVSAQATKTRSYRQTTAPTTGMITGDLWFDSDDNNKAYRYSGTAWEATDDVRITTNAAAIQSEVTARANADTALASNITTLQTTVNGQTTSIQTNATSINGINAKYTVKIDNNGYVSGYGLISDANNGTPTAEFAVIADRFSIAPVATNPNAVDGSPFFVLTAPQVIDGTTIPAGTYMKKAFIHDATITTAKIADAAITSAKIFNASISSAKIANTISSDNYTATTGWQINKAGTMFLNQANVRGEINVGDYTGGYNWPATGGGVHISADGILFGNPAGGSGKYFQVVSGINGGQAGIFTNIPAYIEEGQIDSAKIANTIQSTNYSSTTGWQINKSGQMYLNQANVRGEINVGSFTGFNWPPAGQGGVHISSNGILLGNYNGGGKYLQINSGLGNGVASIFTNIPAYIEDAQITRLKIGNGQVFTDRIAVNAVTNTASAQSNGTTTLYLASNGGLLNIIAQVDQSGPINANQVLNIYINGSLAEVLEGSQVVIGSTGGDAGTEVYGFSQTTRVKSWGVAAGTTTVTFTSPGGRSYTAIAMITQR